MRPLPLLAVAAVLFSAAACGGEVQDQAQRDVACGLNSSGPSDDLEPRLFADDYVGKSLDEATSLAAQQGGVIRVVGTDGDCVAALSADENADRVNVYVSNGEVAQAEVF